MEWLTSSSTLLISGVGKLAKIAVAEMCPSAICGQLVLWQRRIVLEGVCVCDQRKGNFFSPKTCGQVSL